MMSEMGSVSPNYVENKYHNSIYDKKSLGCGSAMFFICPTAAILNFEIQLVSLNISFSMVLRNFYAKWDLCIMICSEKSLSVSTTNP